MYSQQLHHMERMWRDYFRQQFASSPTSSSSQQQQQQLHHATLQQLFMHLLQQFSSETRVWMHQRILQHRRCATTRARLEKIAGVHKLSVEALTADMLRGYMDGYFSSRQTLIQEVYGTLAAVAAAGGPLNGGLTAHQAAWLRELAVEVSILMSPRQMLRSFSSVVSQICVAFVRPRDYVADVAAAAAAAAGGGGDSASASGGDR